MRKIKNVEWGYDEFGVFWNAELCEGNGIGSYYDLNENRMRDSKEKQEADLLNNYIIIS